MASSPWTVAAELCAAEVTVQLREYDFPVPNESVEFDAAPVLGFNLARPRSMGTARHSLPGQGTRFGTLGPLVFMPGGIALETRGSGGRQRVGAFRFPASRFAAVTGLADWDAGRLAACLDIRTPPVEQAVLRLAAETRAPGFASGVLADSLGLLLMIELARLLRAPPAMAAGATGARRLSGAQLHTIRALVEEAEGRQPRLAELAEACGMGVRSLTRAFRATTGRSIGRYAEETRIARAKALLAGTGLPLKTIAWRLGFAHPAAFTAAFRRAMGVAPALYRSTLGT
jgi:AraC family transcriptional regulator